MSGFTKTPGGLLEVYTFILKDWRDRVGTNATVKNLVSKLANLGYAELAQKIVLFLDNPQREKHNSETVSLLSNTTFSTWVQPWKNHALIDGDKHHLIYVQGMFLIVFAMFFLTMLVTVVSYNQSKHLSYLSMGRAGQLDRESIKEEQGNRKEAQKVDDKLNFFSTSDIPIVEYKTEHLESGPASNRKTFIITGFHTISGLMEKLSNASIATTIEINNIDDQLCSNLNDNSTALGSVNLKFPKLKRLTLTHFRTCKEVYKILSEWIVIESLEHLELINGAFDTVNIPMIVTMLLKSFSTLRSIYITGIQENDLGLLSNEWVDNKVSNITYNVQMKQKNIVIGEAFCNAFPYLESMESSTLISLYEFQNILKCPFIKNVKAAIVLLYKDGYWRINPLRKYGSMKRLELKLQFDICPSKQEILSLGLHELQFVATTTKIISNCSMLPRDGTSSSPSNRYKEHYGQVYTSNKNKQVN